MWQGQVAKAQQASDHHYPSTRNAYHNSAMQAYIFHEVGNYITQSYPYEYVLANFYNTNYLFHEPISWAKKVNRVVDLSDYKTESEKQLRFLLQNVQITLYKDSFYREPFSIQQVDSLRDSIGFRFDKIMLRENWYFHPGVKGFKRAYLALGLLSKDNKVLAWYPYQSLRTFVLLAGDTFGKYQQFDAFLQDGMFPTLSLSCSATRCGDEYALDGFGNELDALFEIAEFVNRVRYWESLSKKERQIRQAKSTKYSLQSSMLEGPASWPSFTNDAICSVNFNAGIANGVFSMSQKNQVLMKGNFVNGLREGLFESFFPNGNKRSAYYFKASVQDSIQKVWYPNAQLRMVYQMKDGEMHGDYQSFREDGKIFEKGAFSEGIVQGEWEFKIPLIHYFCYYMNETSFEWTVKDYILEDAFKDCVMELEMSVEKKMVKGCPEGYCVIATLLNKIY